MRLIAINLLTALLFSQCHVNLLSFLREKVFIYLFHSIYFILLLSNLACLHKLFIFQFNALKWFNAVYAGAWLGLANPLIAGTSVYFLLTRNAFIQSQNVFTTSNWRHFSHALPHHISARCETSERGNGPVLVVCALAHTNTPACTVAFIIS